MRYTGCRGFVIAVSVMAAVVFFCASPAADEENGEEVRRRFLPNKPYLQLDASQVTSLARDGRQVDVRFGTEFVSRTRVPSGDRQVEVRGNTYNISHAVRFQNDILGLIPSGHDDTIARAADLRSGQLVTVYGIVMRRRAGDNYFLIERLLTREDRIRPEAGYLLRLRGTRGTVKSISAPGEYSLEFPCRYEPGAVETVRVSVTAVSRRELDRRLADILGATNDSEEAEQEGIDESEDVLPEREYTFYRPAFIYEAIGRGESLDAWFTGTFRRRVRNFPAGVTDYEGRRIRIGGAFETGPGPIVCLVPARNEEQLQKLNFLLPDMDVRVRGTTLRTIGGDRLFLADELDVPGLIEPPEPDHHWIVTVRPGSDRPLVFYREGRYILRFSCRQHGEREEVLGAELLQRQIIEMAP